MAFALLPYTRGGVLRSRVALALLPKHKGWGSKAAGGVCTAPVHKGWGSKAAGGVYTAPARRVLLKSFKTSADFKYGLLARFKPLASLITDF